MKGRDWWRWFGRAGPNPCRPWPKAGRCACMDGAPGPSDGAIRTSRQRFRTLTLGAHGCAALDGLPSDKAWTMRLEGRRRGRPVTARWPRSARRMDAWFDGTSCRPRRAERLCCCPWIRWANFATWGLSTEVIGQPRPWRSSSFDRWQRHANLRILAGFQGWAAEWHQSGRRALGSGGPHGRRLARMI